MSVFKCQISNYQLGHSSDRVVTKVKLMVTVCLDVSGCITPFRSVQLFCGYTMAGVVFCYFYQLSFTVACLAFAGHAESDNKHCITLRTIKPPSHAGQYLPVPTSTHQYSPIAAIIHQYPPVPIGTHQYPQ